MKKLNGDRFALVMITATLVVIMLITGQFLLHRQKSRTLAIMKEGRNVVQLLANLPIHQLLPKQNSNSILDLLNRQQSNPDFAYAAIVDLKGQPLAVSTSGKTEIPHLNISNGADLWTSEYELASVDGNHHLFEFRTPLLDQGKLVGHVRLGYFKPRLELAEISFLAQLALPIFLLVPLTYLLIRRELKPIKKANLEINDAMHKQHIKQVSDKDNDFENFMDNFKYFITEIDKKFDQLSDQRFKEKASSLTLTYQNQRTTAALQSLPDAILVMDESGKTTFTNSKLPPLLNKKPEQMIGSKVDDWCENLQIKNLLNKYQGTSFRFQQTESIDFHPPNSPEQTISVKAYPLFLAKDTDTINGTLVVFKDRSAEVMAHQAREQFINHVSHELKSPLNVIHMYAESLLEEDLEATQRIRSINVINDEVERLSQLINNLLNISKIEAGSIALSLQRVKLHDFLSDTFDSVARSGNELNLQFKLDLPRSLPTIQLDKDLLRIALNNLLTNAVKYNTQNGVVSLSAEETENTIILKIKDTGIGIAEKDQHKVFEKFYRSEDDQITQINGHGLGLALAKEIIEIHQGKISLQSALNQGSEFTVMLKKTHTFLKSKTA